MTVRDRITTLRRSALVVAAGLLGTSGLVALWSSTTSQTVTIDAATVPPPTYVPTITDTSTSSSTTTVSQLSTNLWRWSTLSTPTALADTLNDGNSTTCTYTPPGSTTSSTGSCANLAGIAAVPSGGSITVSLPSSVASTAKAVLLEVQTIEVNSSGTEIGFPVTNQVLATTTTGLNETTTGTTYTWTNNSGANQAVVLTLLAYASRSTSASADTFEFITPTTLCAPNASFTTQCASSYAVSTTSSAQTITLTLPSSVPSNLTGVLVNVAAYGTLPESYSSTGSPTSWGAAAAAGAANSPLPLLPIDLGASAPSSPSLANSVAMLSPKQNAITVPVEPSSSGTVTLTIGALENPWASGATSSTITSTNVTLVVQVVGYIAPAPHTVGSLTTPGYQPIPVTPWSQASDGGTTIGTSTNTAPAISTTTSSTTLTVSGTSQPNASGLASDEAGTVVSAPLADAQGELVSAQIANGNQPGPLVISNGGATVTASPSAESTTSATIGLNAQLASGTTSWSVQVLVPTGACITSVANATASGSACNVSGETGYAGQVTITPSSATATPSFVVQPDTQNSVVDLPSQYAVATNATNGAYGGSVTTTFGDLLAALVPTSSTSTACTSATSCGTLVLDTENGSVANLLTRTNETTDPTTLTLGAMGSLGLTQGADELTEITSFTVLGSLLPAWAAVNGYSVSVTPGASSFTDAVGNTYTVNTSCDVNVAESSSTTLTAPFSCASPVVPAGYGASAAPSSYTTSYAGTDYITGTSSGTTWTWRSVAGPAATLVPQLNEY
jgi:hypothetical protein